MKFYSRQKRMPTVIIVSLIDILAILLIFVIVTTTFRRQQPEVVIRLPESTTAAGAATPADPITLAVAADSRIFLESEAVKIDELLPALREIWQVTPARPLSLRADSGAPFGTIVRVLDVLKEAGLDNVPAFTEQAEAR